MLSLGKMEYDSLTTSLKRMPRRQIFFGFMAVYSLFFQDIFSFIKMYCLILEKPFPYWVKLGCKNVTGQEKPSLLLILNFLTFKSNSTETIAMN